PATSQRSFVFGNHEIVISQTQLTARSVYTPVDGDHYTWFTNGSRITWGTVGITGNNYAFTPAEEASALGSEPFKATLSGNSLANVQGLSGGTDIVLKTGTSISQITTMAWGPIGTWTSSGTIDGYSYSSTLVVTASSWTWDLTIDGYPEPQETGTYEETGGNTYKAWFVGESDVVSTAYLKNKDTLVVTLTNYTIYPGTYNYTRQ
ncbi:MAG: hypothetical protein FWC22_01435, partial [Treponema sp.]|nr:hypothetical protein [Treponema sp.]